MSIVGFSGTRRGMTQAQREGVRIALVALRMTEFHHGDCTGADEQAHNLVRHYLPAVVIVSHPTVFISLRAFTDADREMDAAPPLERNEDIVRAVEHLVAAPKGEEIRRSGTWHAIRFARDAYKPVTIVRRDGTRITSIGPDQ